jgi:hypothetical protein
MKEIAYIQLSQHVLKCVGQGLDLAWAEIVSNPGQMLAFTGRRRSVEYRSSSTVAMPEAKLDFSFVPSIGVLASGFPERSRSTA